MNRTAATQFRRERGDEIKKLADILIRKGILQNVEPLSSASSVCYAPPSLLDKFKSSKTRRGMEFWSYQVSDLLFRGVDEACLKDSIPYKPAEVEIILNAYLYGICLDDNPRDISNPFVQLSVNIETRALDRESNVLKCAWHLDKNIVEDKDNESDFAHPDYHFQHGGFKVNDIKNYGEHLILAVPRLAHPPLDGILAVDFVLSNYFGSKWRGLREDSEYQKIVRAAQERCWSAYALSTAMEWKSPINWQENGFISNWKANLIWSQIISRQNQL